MSVKITDTMWSKYFEHMDEFEKGYMTALYDMVINENVQIKGGNKVLFVSKLYKTMQKINEKVYSRHHGTYTNVQGLPYSLEDRLTNGNA